MCFPLSKQHNNQYPKGKNVLPKVFKKHRKTQTTNETGQSEACNKYKKGSTC
jgi:hypothetical protein